LTQDGFSFNDTNLINISILPDNYYVEDSVFYSREFESANDHKFLLRLPVCCVNAITGIFVTNQFQ